MSAVMAAGAAVTVSAQCKTGEEDGADDEHHTGDDRHPGSGLVDPIGSMSARRRRRNGCGCGILLECFSHAAIVTASV